LIIKLKRRLAGKSAGAEYGTEGRRHQNNHKVNEIPTVSGLAFKNPIDLAGISGYNGSEVIYLLGMAFAFPTIQKGGLWLMDTEIKNAVSATDQDAQYDDKAKRLLGNKIILAHILVKTVDEFKGMNPKDVVSYIEGEPFISVVPVEPGLTNAEKEKDGQRIVGLNTENAEINEGLIRFDIIFLCTHERRYLTGYCECGSAER